MGGRASHAGSQHQISLQHGDGDAGEDILNILLYQFLQVSIQKRLQPDWKISTSLIKSPALAKKKSSTEHSHSHSKSKRCSVTTVKGRCQPVSRTKPPLRRKLRSSNTNTKDILQTQSVCKLKYVLTKKLQIQKPTKHRKCEYLKNITNTKGLQIQICAYKKHRKYKIPQL